jgi:hypothetical protein
MRVALSSPATRTSSAVRHGPRATVAAHLVARTVVRFMARAVVRFLAAGTLYLYVPMMYARVAPCL